MAALLLLAGQARAHEQVERRHLLISVDGDHVDVLVAYELPSSALARDLRATIDHDGSGAVDRDAERLARAQVLLPRVTAGWHLTADDQALPLELVEVTWRDGTDTTDRRGFEGLIGFRAPIEPTNHAPRALRLTLEEGAPELSAELQALPPWTIVGSLIPPAQDAPVIGPVVVSPGLPLEVLVQSAASDP